MNWRHKQYLLISVSVACAVALYAGAEYLATKKVADLQSGIESTLSKQKELMQSLAEATARSGTDQITEGIIKDCDLEERQEFDVLLGRLDQGLSIGELTELERLFGRCGYFFAERKSIMVARLEREVEFYTQSVQQLDTLTMGNNSERFAVEGWKVLVQNERKQSTMFMDLVRAQDQIIIALMAGNTPQSAEILAILKEVQELQESQIVLSKQNSTLKDELLAK
jgi:hypothetical protein